MPRNSKYTFFLVLQSARSVKRVDVIFLVLQQRLRQHFKIPEYCGTCVRAQNYKGINEEIINKLEMLPYIAQRVAHVSRAYFFNLNYYYKTNKCCLKSIVFCFIFENTRTYICIQTQTSTTVGRRSDMHVIRL